MLAKIVNDNAGSLIPRGVLRFFASKLAPTGGQGFIVFEICVGLRASIGPQLLSPFSLRIALHDRPQNWFPDLAQHKSTHACAG
ncbi:hypothetical protein C7A12_28490 [Pseudomonas fluorescens]|uniref:Uncharacterized protein n=1 Tax=Pseudomonas fluorescens TaxID=294 RepID=A0A2T0HLV4_PSEFL|nr:hypothetical protein C1751_27160 [Pseudomonas fluorescens]PRW71429.1 hypothetical protein C7A12_28490 [Pseudomonas fluorescens]PRW72007.1 hypothetical protein C7A13_28565 [Pseudomonas fluorescens]PRW84072.1 hypothetical protein C7A10_29845 [Pseudomonas fluorescens]